MSFWLRAAVLASLSALLMNADPLAWPMPTRFARPWSYWWWMGSAVDRANLTRELTDFQKAGWGGVHIIPIYGAVGYEDRSIEYLSPKWMEMLRHTVSEAGRLDMGVDMTTGTGWCFGGPTITPELAGAFVRPRMVELKGGEQLTGTGADAAWAVPAAGGTAVAVRSGWTAPDGSWKGYVLSTKPTIKVKRASPGGGGYMINPFYGDALQAFLKPFTAAFGSYSGPKPRAMYHDSYEYQSDWSPDLLKEFEARRGYRLQDEFPALFGDAGDRTARVKCDYRQTISELLLDRMTRPWVDWAHARGFVTRNEAHGAPGNLLDLYAAADIPETEMFNRDRSMTVAKFASSAAHVSGKNLVASETGTWLKEHFTETLADMKDLVDQLFITGVNHVFYHGSAYSPAEAAWPGWLFYASTEMNSRNSIWHDVPALNAYITRAQSMLQEGTPDNDVLMYWPVSDVWHDAQGMTAGLTVHHRAWVDEQAFGRLAEKLFDRGYSTDFISDRQLREGKIGRYKAVVIPETAHMPVETMRALADLPIPVVFERRLPDDVPGLANLEQRRAALRQIRGANWTVGDVEGGLAKAGVRREDLPAGLRYIRRRTNDGVFYFLDNRGTAPFGGWIALSAQPRSAVLLDAMSGRVGGADVKDGKVYLRLEPGETVFLRAWGSSSKPLYSSVPGEAIPLNGAWEVTFVSGGPVLPAAQHLASPSSWTAAGGDAERFAGTARYTTRFDAPDTNKIWWIDLGRVADSARIRLNGRELGTLIGPPYRIQAGSLKAKANVLEVEVTSVSANRIRDLDRRQVKWQVFHDINFVNLDYKPFSAADWPVRDSGLLGPVTLRPGR